ncbi:hypothetical protein BRADI_2g20430v3 [Brachypodium distachyon]|uniref:DUF4220 domain-containing protein n=1 Tax=Brachypodium distachyon TaxID=15368 RepID=A0A0Q3G2G4_BRADI|nr:hypothetical protein BRADI_2g20430v3 [Brachypodium distachyon]
MEVPTTSSKAGNGGGVRIFENLNTVEGRLLRLEVVVLLSALVLAALVLYGSTVRRSSDRLLRGVMWIAYSLSYVVVTYAVGIIQDGPFHGETFVLWAAALLLIQASAYAAPVHSRRDVDQRKKLLLQHVLQTGLVLWLVLNATGANASYRAAIWAFWSLNVLKTAAKIAEMVKASLPDRSVKVIADYMDVEESLAADDEPLPPDPETMRGYKYIFHGEDIMELTTEYGRLSPKEIRLQSSCKSVVTIDQVYRWIDTQDDYSEKEKDMARDFCLAFALFKLLKRRFYGYVPAEARSSKALNLVLNGLIHHQDAVAMGTDAAFRVVDAELAFLYDFFYTRNIVLVGVRTYICIAVVVLALTLWAAFYGTLGPAYRRLVIGVKDLDRSVTVVVVVITAGLEMCQALAAFSNNWRYTKRVYRCVRDGRPWRRGGHGDDEKKRRPGVWRIWWWWNKENIAPPETKYWEEKIGEYVLLKRYDHRPLNLLSWMTLYLVEPRRQGQKRGRRKDLPWQVRRAVLGSFKASQGKLSNGIVALGKHGLLPRLAWACEEFPKVTDQILVWHVVTTRCDWICRRRHRHESHRRRYRGGGGEEDRGHGHGDELCGGDDRVVATKLSSYCAYLVAFVPEMLPDPSYNAEQIFDTAVQQARCHLAECRDKDEILARLDEIEAEEMDAEAGGGGGAGAAPGNGRAGSRTVIEKAARLGGQLEAAVRGDEARRWGVLAEFWAELVLFLAPSDNVDVHAEMLGAGGEFMTQLWALLSHAGVM